MGYEEILRELKQRKFRPIYFLMGEEPYFIDKITDVITEHALSESEKSFNQVILYGRDTHITEVVNAAKRFPMMASHQVVIVREAQEMKQLDDLAYYAEAPLTSTILVINYKYKKLDRRKKLFRILDQNAVVFESKRLYEDRIPQWINQQVHARGKRIEPKAAAMLTEFLGTDLGRIETEINKLLLVMEPDNDTITPARVEENIGISKDYNHFELNNALAQRNVLKANRIANYFASNPRSNPIALTLTSMYFFFSKVLSYHHTKDRSRSNLASVLRVDPYFIPDYEKAAKQYPPGKTMQVIALLRTYDRKSKGIGNAGNSPGELLKELVYKIMH